MVYCSKCGAKNEEDETECTSCGAHLYLTRRGARRARRMRERECFGLPQGGAIFGLFIGMLIVVAGFVFFLQETGLVPEGFDVLWPLAVIVFGLLFVAGAIYGLTRR